MLGAGAGATPAERFEAGREVIRGVLAESAIRSEESLQGARCVTFQALDDAGGKLFSLTLNYAPDAVHASFRRVDGGVARRLEAPYGEVYGPWLAIVDTVRKAAREERRRMDPPEPDVAGAIAALIEADPDTAAERLAAIVAGGWGRKERAALVAELEAAAADVPARP